MHRLLSLAVLLTVPALSAADWPVFRGQANGVGVGVAKLPDQLDERWAFKTGGSIEGAAAIADGVAYVGSTDKHLYAIDIATGKEKWKTKLDYIKASPAVRGKRIYVGDNGGVLHCLDTETGKEAWKFETTGGEIASGCNFHGENVLLAAQGIPLYCIGPDGGKVWEFPIDGGSNGTPTVVGGAVFAGGCDSTFHAIDAKTGKELWSVPVDGQAASTPAVVGEFAFIPTMTNQVVAIDLKAKKKAWTFEPAKRAQAFYSSAAVTDDLVVVGSRDNKVYALDRKTGVEKWNFLTEGMVDASPVVVGARVYVGCLSSTGEFYVLDLKTGKKLQEVTLDSGVSGSVAVGADFILVGTEKGSLYCLGKK